MNLISRIASSPSPSLLLARVSGPTAHPAVDHAGLYAIAIAPPSKPSGLAVVSRTGSSLGISSNSVRRVAALKDVYRGSMRVASYVRDDLHLQRVTQCATSYRVRRQYGESSGNALPKRGSRLPDPPLPRRLRKPWRLACFASARCLRGVQIPLTGTLCMRAPMTASRPAGSTSVTA